MLSPAHINPCLIAGHIITRTIAPENDFFERDTQKGVLIYDSYQGKRLAVQGMDSLTHNDTKKIKLH
jgi:hypothetical protein